MKLEKLTKTYAIFSQGILLLVFASSVKIEYPFESPYFKTDSKKSRASFKNKFVNCPGEPFDDDLI